MKEALVVLLLVMLWMTYPVVSLIDGISQANVRQEQLMTISYAGTARELYEEHKELLNAAMENLWAHPEFFEQYRMEHENDASFPLYELRRGWEVEHPFTEDEWQVILELVGQRWFGSLWYYWGRAPVITCSVLTEEPERPTLLYIRRAEHSPADVRAELRYHLQFADRYEQIPETDWTIRYYMDP